MFPCVLCVSALSRSRRELSHGESELGGRRVEGPTGPVVGGPALSAGCIRAFGRSLHSRVPTNILGGLAFRRVILWALGLLVLTCIIGYASV